MIHSFHTVTILMKTVIFPMQQLVMQETNVGIRKGTRKHFGVSLQTTIPLQATPPIGTFVMFPSVQNVIVSSKKTVT